MVQIVMYVALGFLLASLVALLLAPPLWRRAVRLTTRRLQATMPMTPAEIEADKDLTRAQYAVALRRVEMAFEKARDRAARNLVERNKRQIVINAMQADIDRLRAALDARANEMRVLEQTVQRHFPEYERQLNDARAVIADRDAELLRLANTVENQSEAIERNRKTSDEYWNEIATLRRALEGDETVFPMLHRFRSKHAEHQRLIKRSEKLEAELSRAREEVRMLQDAAERDTAQLKLEIRRLGDRIMGEAAARKAAEGAAIDAAGAALADDSADAEESEEDGDAQAAMEDAELPAPAIGNAGDDAAKAGARPPRRSKRAARKPDRRRLTARLKAAAEGHAEEAANPKS